MVGRGFALVLCLVLASCTRVVDAPQPTSEPPVAPIAAGQVHDLLSKHAQQGGDGDLFRSVTPADCSGVAQEVDAPFVFDAHPAAHDGGHWKDTARTTVFIEEIVGVYRTDFDPKAALNHVTRTLDACRDVPFTVTSLSNELYVFRLLPRVDSGSPDIVVWSFATDRWACDNAFVAAHNAAIEITTCAPAGGYDVLSLARDASKRIATLANTTA